MIASKSAILAVTAVFGGLALAAVPSTRPSRIAVADLPIIRQMPDPLTMSDGTKVTTPEQWRTRRKEMIDLLEEYEYGHMPPPPGNVRGTITAARRITVSAGRGGRRGPATLPAARADAGPAPIQADYRMVHLTFGPDEKLGFDLGIFTPVDPGTPVPDTTSEFRPARKYPILISLGFGAGENSIGASYAALQRGYAVATIGYNQLGADNPNYRATGFFAAYPEYDWNDFSAWAWGLSRAVDYLVTDPAIDKDKIMVTGTSRTGQAAFLAGAFDERIALTAPVAGGMALRYSGKEVGDRLGQGIAEVVDQQTYWFGPRLPEFKGNTYRLPTDQHFLVALTAPRLFIMCNSMADQYGRPLAAVKTYEAAKPVFDFLQVPDNVGLHFRPGGHGMQAEDWSALLDFADQKLLKKPGTRRFDIIPPAEQLK